MQPVRPKKHLGQHFLHREDVAERIANVALTYNVSGPLLEIGPGTGMLTKYLLKNENIQLKACELDRDSVEYLKQHYPDLEVFSTDFLKAKPSDFFTEPFSIMGNFPYNISSQIVFWALECDGEVPFLAGMFQREMAQRITASPGGKDYGIISVLTQSMYECKYLFTVSEGAFNPPPKVKSGVIALKRLDTLPDIDFRFFKAMVKTAFGQRRKTMRNSLRSMVKPEMLSLPIFDKRPEQLSVKELQELSVEIKGV